MAHGHKVEARVRVRIGGYYVYLSPHWTETDFLEQTDARKQHIVRAHVSLPYFFHHVMLPHESDVEEEQWPRRLPRYQRFVTSWMQHCLRAGGTGTFQLDCVLPTSFMKTTMARAAAAWYVARHRSRCVLICGATAAGAEATLASIKSHVIGNQEFIDIFGDMYPRRLALKDPFGKWTNAWASVVRPNPRRTPTFAAAGVGSDIQGLRFDGLVVDDIVNRDNARTEHSRQEVETWYDQSARTRLDKRRRWVVSIGSRWHPEDFHGHVLQEARAKRNWVVLTAPAVVNRDGLGWPPALPEGWTGEHCQEAAEVIDFEGQGYQSLWPQHWPMKALYLDWLQSPVVWEAVRQCRPVQATTSLLGGTPGVSMLRADGGKMPAGTRFLYRPKLRAWTLDHTRRDWEIEWARQGVAVEGTVLSMDPNSGRSKTGRVGRLDYFVLQLWVRDRQGRRILAWMHRTRAMSRTTLVKLLTDVIVAFRPDSIRCEGEAMGSWMIGDMTERLGVPIQDSRMARNKDSFIENLQALIGYGMILYAADQQDDVTVAMMRPFEYELQQFPGGDHDDTVAAALHAQAGFGVVDPEVLGAPTIHDVDTVLAVEDYDRLLHPETGNAYAETDQDRPPRARMDEPFGGVPTNFEVARAYLEEMEKPGGIDRLLAETERRVAALTNQLPAVGVHNALKSEVSRLERLCG